MWFGINSYKEDFFNIFVHESGHWGRLPDIDEITVPVGEIKSIKEVMNQYSSRERKVGPSPDEFTNFYRGGSSPGYSREDGAYQLKKRNMENKTKPNK
jgi:hypothetical protein